MGLFSFGERDVHKALGQTAPGVRWRVVSDASNPRVWYAALQREARPQFPSLSVEQAQMLAPDVWANLRALRARVSRIEIWVEADSGKWVGASEAGTSVLDSLPPQFA